MVERVSEGTAIKGTNRVIEGAGGVMVSGAALTAGRAFDNDIFDVGNMTLSDKSSIIESAVILNDVGESVCWHIKQKLH